jgi:general stress protein YciG
MASRSKRGFAAMDPEKQREIARLGGRAAHEKGTAHEFTPDEARRAGRRGGKTVSRDRAYMAEIGRRGGQHSQGGRGQAETNGRRANVNVARGRGAAARTGRGVGRRAKAGSR